MKTPKLNIQLKELAIMREQVSERQIYVRKARPTDVPALKTAAGKQSFSTLNPEAEVHLGRVEANYCVVLVAMERCSGKTSSSIEDSETSGR